MHVIFYPHSQLSLPAYTLSAFYFQMAERNQLNPVVPTHCLLLEIPVELLKIYWYHDFDLFDLGWSSGIRIF